jgi:hypothetical protein
MYLDIKTHGDSLEKEFSNLIKERIPNYELIWKNYIGHDGLGRMLKSIGLDENKEKKRVLLAEYHYTCLESIVGLYLIISKIDDFSYNSIKDLILQNNDIIAFHAHVGRIRDCIKKMGEQFVINDIYLRFDKCWRERCSVLHGKKLPFAVLDGIYFVLKDAELIEEKSGNQVLSWNDFDGNDFNFLNDYLKQSFELIINEVNSSLAVIYGRLKDEFNAFNLNYEGINFDMSLNKPLSGTTTYSITNQSSANYSKIVIIDDRRKKKKK